MSSGREMRVGEEKSYTKNIAEYMSYRISPRSLVEMTYLFSALCG